MWQLFLLNVFPVLVLQWYLLGSGSTCVTVAGSHLQFLCCINTFCWRCIGGTSLALWLWLKLEDCLFYLSMSLVLSSWKSIGCIGGCPVSAGLWCRISAGLGMLLESGVALSCNSPCFQSCYPVAHLDNICLSVCIILSIWPLLWT